MSNIRFGPAGNDILFYEQGFKSSVQSPKWLRDLGLDAFEVCFGRGVRMSEETARKIGEEAKKEKIEVSAHAPYYINLTNNEVFEKNYHYISTSLRVLSWLGGARLVMHLGWQGKHNREDAIKNVTENLKLVMKRLKEEGFKDFLLCIETMGKFSQIGNLEEIIDICKVDSKIIPCIDFGHINCLLQGKLDVQKVMVAVEHFKELHIHWSAIEFTSLGERRHTTLDDKRWAFPFEPLAKLLRKDKRKITVICESLDIMAQDAKRLKKTFD